MKDDRLEIQPLDYDTELTFEEAKKRLEEVESALSLVKRKYSGFLSRMKTEISEDDTKMLSDCIGVLLPLGMNSVVQQEIINSENLSETLHAKSALLNQDIMLFLARFKNSGVKVIKGSPFGEF